MSAEESIRRHEGYREIPYRDSLGFWTTGTGILLERMPIPSYMDTVGQLLDLITDPNWQEAQFQKHLARAGRDARLFAGEAWNTLSDARRDVLVEMAYQMGFPRLSSFKDFRKAVKEGRHVAAHEAMLNSKWAREQAPGRAHELADKYLEG